MQSHNIFIVWNPHLETQEQGPSLVLLLLSIFNKKNKVTKKIVVSQLICLL